MKTLLYILAALLALTAVILLTQARSAFHETTIAVIFLGALVCLVGGVIAGKLEPAPTPKPSTPAAPAEVRPAGELMAQAESTIEQLRSLRK